MTDHSKTSQDLRTAAWADLSPAEIVRRTRCEADAFGNGFTRAAIWRDCCDAILSKLSTPPRPDHAGGVEAAAEAMRQDESLRASSRRRSIPWAEEAEDVREKWLRLARVAITTAQAPPQAAEREGVEAAGEFRSLCEVLITRFAAGAPIDTATTALAQFALDHRSEIYAALAPSPTGTEASRGVGAEKDADYDLVAEWLDWNATRTGDVYLGDTASVSVLRAFISEKIELSLAAANPTPPVSPPDSTGQGETPKVDVWRMGLSDGRTDYFVRLSCGGRSQTPHVFRERFKAEYEVARLQWVLGLRPDKPDLMAYDETSHPNDVNPSQADAQTQEGGE